MIDIATHDDARRRLHCRAATVPIVSTLAGSATALLPIVADMPIVPPFGLLMLLAWRLLRPELWPAAIGVPLGLADDLLSGRPLGSAMALWTMILLAIEASEDRMAWRGRGEEWLLAAIACGAVVTGNWAVARFVGDTAPLRVTVPMAIGSVLLFPLAQRLCARLDIWRLRT